MPHTVGHIGEDDDMAANRVTSSLAGLALAIGLLVACLFVLRGLQEKSRVEDCIMSGRMNCDRLVAKPAAPASVQPR